MSKPVRQRDDQALAHCRPPSTVSERGGTRIALSGETQRVIEQKSAEAVRVDGEDRQKQRAERLNISKAYHAQ